MRRTLGLAGGLLVAVALSQFPEYAQQYTQRLGGAVDELHAITTGFDTAATAAGLTHDQAIAHYSSSPDSFLAGQGNSMTGTFRRYAQLSETLAELRGAGPFERVHMLPSYFDTDIGMRTLDDFKPAVPVTPEGFAYAGAGLILGYILTSVLWSLLTLPFRWRRRRRWGQRRVIVVEEAS